MTMKSEPNEFEHALAICQDKLEAAEREIEQIKNLNYSAIIRRLMETGCLEGEKL